MNFDGQRIENTLYFYNAGGPAVADMNVLGADLEGWWTTNCAPLLPIDVTLREIVLTDLTTQTGLQVTWGISSPVAGTLGQPALPNNVSLAVSFRTDLRGRSFRGRNYIPALTEGQVVNSAVNQSVADDWADAYRAILTVVTNAPSPYVWAIATRFSGVDSDGKPIPRVAGGVQPVTAVVVTDLTVDSMRRRLPGRGQ
jgi:hypothetical protein